MPNNSLHRSGRGRYFGDRSRRNRRNDEGASYRTSRSHENSFRRTRNNSSSHQNQYPYNTYERDQLAQHDSQNAYHHSRQQYYPPEPITRSNDNYDNSRFQSNSEDVLPWTSYDQYRFSRSGYYPPEAGWETPQEAYDQFNLVYPRTQHYPPSNHSNWWSSGNAYENANRPVNDIRFPNGNNRNRSSDNSSQELSNSFWWDDSSDATKLLHEYFWRPNTGGEIRCIICRRNYTTVTEGGESVMSSACGHLFCTGCLNYEFSSNYCWICNIRVLDLWKIFM